MNIEEVATCCGDCGIPGCGEKPVPYSVIGWIPKGYAEAVMAEIQSRTHELMTAFGPVLIIEDKELA